MDVCVGKSSVLNKKPVAYLTCNGSPPVSGQPSLMTFREVETLFHEFGHGLQHMLTTVEHGRLLLLLLLFLNIVNVVFTIVFINIYNIFYTIEYLTTN